MLQAPCALAGKYEKPKSKVEVSLSGIRFNGLHDESHEDFFYREDQSFDFCKTARKDYDVVVVATLCLVAYFRLAQVSSDGGKEDWLLGLALARSATGLDISMPLTIDD